MNVFEVQICNGCAMVGQSYMQSAMRDEFLLQTRLVIGGWLAEAGVDAPVVPLERPAEPQFGEYSTTVAMRYAKDIGRSPQAIAADLVARLNRAEIPGLADAVAVAPGFVNLYLTTAAKRQHLADIMSAGARFGTNTHYSEERWVVEHTSPNPNKAMHLGHLRNNLVGMGIVRLLQASGAEVIADAVYNDRGIAIAKVMYGYLAHKQRAGASQPATPAAWHATPDAWVTPTEVDVAPDRFVTECYVAAEADMQDEAIETAVRQLVIDWEAGDAATVALWRHVLAFAYSGIDRTLARLGSHWDKVWYESDHYQKGKAYVEAGLAQGVFTQTEDGAVVTQLEERYGLPDTVVLKRDGTSLYITQDLALTDLKKQTYHADKLVWVVGPEQTLAFAQLFAVCEQLGIGRREDFTHVSYGYVGLRDEEGAFQKMSSRAGTVVLIDDVIDAVKKTISERLETPATADETVAERLALGAVKFAFLKSDRTQDISFDVEQSLDTQGDSGMYVLYTYARARSILRKATKAPTHVTDAAVGSEAQVLRTLLYYPDVVEQATRDLSVHHVAQYLLTLCSEFNRWYAAETFLDGSDAEAYPVLVGQAGAHTIENGLALLRISPAAQT